MEGSNFLDKKYPDFTGSKPVERAVRKLKREGKKAPHDRAERIDAYLNRLEDIFEDKRGLSLLKHKILEKYTTKQEEIPESYWKLQEKIIRERGQGGDWANASEEDKQELKRQNSEGVLGDQRASLEQWLDYLALPDSNFTKNESLNRALKYWVFRNVVGLQEYDKEKKEFPKRSKGTIKQFPDINHEALGYVVDAVIKKLGGETLDFEYDIQADERQEFLKFLEKEDFAKLYAWANELMNPIPEHLLPITDGEWRKYNKNSNSQELVQKIRGKGTGWCTAGENTAKTQLTGGDFYVFYSLDDDQKPTIPRIAIRMEGDKIAEVRGVAYKQNLDPYMGEVLTAKLEEFPDKAQYLKKEADMQRLTVIENKIKAKQELNRDDLVFLYEINSPIAGFGYQKDPRIAELRKQRNTREDMSIVFECMPQEIAYSPTEIKKHTKAYVGIWNPEVLKLLPGNITHVYEKFPDKKVFLRELEFDPTIKNSQSAEKMLIKKDYGISDWAKDILKKTKFSGEKKSLKLVSFLVGNLGFPDGATTTEIFAKAKELGLELAPAEVGPQLRLQYADQPMNEYLYIAMEQITDSDGYPLVFYVGRSADGAWLYAYLAYPDDRWNADSRFVFVSRK